jgi:hypothetical protein
VPNQTDKVKFNTAKEKIKSKIMKNDLENIKKEYPRSYRLDSEIMGILKNSVKRINQNSPKKISEAKLIKALIWLSQEIDEKKILKALKEVW